MPKPNPQDVLGEPSMTIFWYAINAKSKESPRWRAAIHLGEQLVPDIAAEIVELSKDRYMLQLVHPFIDPENPEVQHTNLWWISDDPGQLMRTAVLWIMQIVQTLGFGQALSEESSEDDSIVGLLDDIEDFLQDPQEGEPQ